MIEVVYKDEKKEAVGNEGFFQLPKNIRQIGETSGAYKIYMEDYVHTFLSRIAGQEPGAKIGLLLGKSNWMDGVTYIFVRSALQMEEMDVSPEHIAFTDEVWQQAEDMMQRYFSGQEVVGWFFVMPECAMELTDVLYRTHLNYFGGNDKLLYMMEPLEKEEALFHYENGCMSRQRGFYLYYDKNESMQEYMIKMNKNIPIEKKGEVQDKAVQDFRKIIAGKTAGEEPEKKGGFSLIHAIGACAVAGAIAVGIMYLDNYQKMQETSAKTQQIARQAAARKRQEQMRLSENRISSNPYASEGVQEEPEEAGEEGEAGEAGSGYGQEEELPENTKAVPSAPASEADGTDSSQKGQAEDAAVQGQELEAQGSYVVRNGDTLSIISKRVYGSTGQVRDICRLNNLNINDIIYPGQIILLP